MHNQNPLRMLYPCSCFFLIAKLSKIYIQNSNSLSLGNWRYANNIDLLESARFSDPFFIKNFEPYFFISNYFIGFFRSLCCFKTQFEPLIKYLSFPSLYMSMAFAVYGLDGDDKFTGWITKKHEKNSLNRGKNYKVGLCRFNFFTYFFGLLPMLRQNYLLKT